jgi:hypothetical protein
MPVAGNPTDGIHNGLPPLYHAVEKGGFPDIGPPHDGNDSGHNAELGHKGSVKSNRYKTPGCN